jgi:PAS domain S-box-containing protein
MGDTRFTPYYERVSGADDPAAAIRSLSDESVIAALAAASRSPDPLLATILATEAQNRMRRIRAALEHLGEGVCSVDLGERIVYLNPAARRLLGWNGGDPVGKPLHGHVHGFDDRGKALPEGACLVAEAMRVRRTRHCDAETFVRADGTAFRATYTVAPLIHEDDVDGAVLVFSDVTRREAMEASLRESEARCRALADAAFEGILVHDGQRVLDANRAAHEMLRLPGDARGMLFMDFVAPSSRRRVREAIAGGGLTAFRLECVRWDGTTFHAEVMGRPFPYHGHAARVVAIREVPPGPGEPA